MVSNESKVIAVDFDGTICEEKYPEVGHPLTIAVDTILTLKEQGYRLILNTCREGRELEDALWYMKSWGIFDCFSIFNENLPDRIVKFGNDSRKIGADLYVDDKTVGGPNWCGVRKYFDLPEFDKGEYNE